MGATRRPWGPGRPSAPAAPCHISRTDAGRCPAPPRCPPAPSIPMDALHKETRPRHTMRRDIGSTRQTATITVLFCDLVAVHRTAPAPRRRRGRRLSPTLLRNASFRRRSYARRSREDDGRRHDGGVPRQRPRLGGLCRGYARRCRGAGRGTAWRTCVSASARAERRCDQDDWFGTPVIEAARVRSPTWVKRWSPTSYVCWSATRGELGLRALGPVRFKGSRGTGLHRGSRARPRRSGLRGVPAGVPTHDPRLPAHGAAGSAYRYRSRSRAPLVFVPGALTHRMSVCR